MDMNFLCLNPLSLAQWTIAGRIEETRSIWPLRHLFTLLGKSTQRNLSRLYEQPSSALPILQRMLPQTGTPFRVNCGSRLSDAAKSFVMAMLCITHPMLSQI